MRPVTQHGGLRAEGNLLEALFPDAKLVLSVGMVFATARDERDGGHDGLKGNVCHDRSERKVRRAEPQTARLRKMSKERGGETRLGPCANWRSTDASWAGSESAGQTQPPESDSAGRSC